MLSFLKLLNDTYQEALVSFYNYDNKWAASMGFLLKYKVSVNPTQAMLDHAAERERYERKEAEIAASNWHVRMWHRAKECFV